MPDFSDPAIFNAFAAAGAMAVACAILSVFVVARRWAFMGEGISHSGFGGAGTAWMLAVAFPSLNNETLPYQLVFVFCMLAALAVGWLVLSGRAASDTAIGIFLVASLAWGFIGQHIYVEHYGYQPFGFDNLLFGQMKSISAAYTRNALCVAIGVAICAWGFWKELIAYAFDPLLARTSGVRASLIHYLLLLMIALTIVVGIRVVGTVLVTALLVLPAVTANLLTKRLGQAVTLSIISGLIGAWGGLLISQHYRAIPAGSAIVLTLFVLFL
ncbi:MAG TPA: metal ABC transporter permease, partial [Tepidisphaeraceae bacterium]